LPSILRFRALSSAVEHCPYKAGVTGSNPVAPTMGKTLSEAVFGGQAVFLKSRKTAQRKQIGNKISDRQREATFGGAQPRVLGSALPSPRRRPKRAALKGHLRGA
jgi:hypothetical protein